ncbi:hypothetical protein Taro_019852 [Colocasia esculenta]|uniref:Uncharacterized protein n=1 Tax=Colocasia esculenta TaxID=4460 RepID=A0A843UUL3_COLES|nr:hypothetical protein [Colocasia esculenta]
MGFVVVISLPLILFAVLLGFGCYFFGKTKGRQEVLAGRACQVYGTPATPPGAAGGMSPAHEKKDAPDNVRVHFDPTDDLAVTPQGFVCR